MNILNFFRNLNLFSSEEELSELEQLIAHVDNPAHRAIYEIVIKNQLRYRDNDLASSTQTCPHCNKQLPTKNSTGELLPKIAVKVLDQIIILDDFIGIQPMTGPVGLIYKLQYREVEQEGGEGNGTRLTLEILSEAIEAKSRKLSAAWSIEASEDVKQIHGVDIEDEIIQAVADEIAYEIIDNVLSQMRSDVATPVNLKNFFSSMELSVHIARAANKIAQNTRRGAGNFIIVDPITLSILQGDGESSYVKVDNETEQAQKQSSRIKHVGTLNNTIRVYCDLFGTDTIVGYKGPTETDTGLFYSPYILLMSTGTIMDPLTFQPRIAFMTRYGELQDKRSEMYYATLNVQTESATSMLLEEAS